MRAKLYPPTALPDYLAGLEPSNVLQQPVECTVKSRHSCSASGRTHRWECAAYIEWVSFHWLHAQVLEKGRALRRQNRNRHLHAYRYSRSGYHLQPASREYSFCCWGALYLIRSVTPCVGKY